jgi:hypothetical protein
MLFIKRRHRRFQSHLERKSFDGIILLLLRKITIGQASRRMRRDRMHSELMQQLYKAWAVRTRRNAVRFTVEGWQRAAVACSKVQP